MRCLGLTHDVRNELGDGVRERSAGGLTHFGTKVVQECNRLGIVVDVSHLSDRGTQDVLATSAQPIIASHSNARRLCAHPRNLTDELIRGIARGGGVIGFHALDALVSSNPEPKLEDLLRDRLHYRHEPKGGYGPHLGRVGGSRKSPRSAQLEALKLMPGMPVEAFVETGQRTALSYLMKPLSDQYSKAFREE